MASLETLILKSGAMTPAQLAAVRAVQHSYGGTLDLNILEQGYLTEHVMQRLLAQRWDEKDAPDYREEPAVEALALLSAEQAVLLRAVPLHVNDNLFHIFVHDHSTMESLGDLRELKDFKLEAKVLNEVRLLSLLARCYDVELDQRVENIMGRLEAQAVSAHERRAELADESIFLGDPVAGEAPDEPEPAEDDEDIPIVDIDFLEEDFEELDEADLIEVDESDGSASLAEAFDALDIDGVEGALEALDSMDGIPEIFFRFGAPYFESAAIFKAQGGMFKAWRGAGLGIKPALLRSMMVPTAADTFLGRAVEAGHWRGQAGVNAVENGITQQLGCQDDADVSSAAVIVGKRPVLVLLGVTVGGAISDEALAELDQFRELAGKAVMAQIMARKKASKK